MAEWRHVVSVRSDPTRCLFMVPTRPPCGCDTPTPDPASPCGFWYRTGQCYWDHGIQTSADDEVGHPHQPSRCTCGHSIERVPPEGR